MFLGYASYSKAIMMSIVEITKAFHRTHATKGKVAFASYQHNLQAESEEIQMYYEIPAEFPAELVHDVLEAKGKVKVIQVVPISSTLTTFEKMWMRLGKDISEGSTESITLCGNYSLFWVKDIPQVEGMPTEREEAYWKQYCVCERKIETRFPNMESSRYIRFFIKHPVVWQNPLECDMCYPDNVIDEVPLMETDQTSTVPTQQLRKRRQQKTGQKPSVDLQTNNQRLLELKGCVAYGHVKRDGNHFQWYIATQDYFFKMKERIREWLINCPKEVPPCGNLPLLRIIFSPEHNTNVGFAQYVNTFYFNGAAEIISINEDKEFRSNFECENMAIMHTIQNLFHNYAESGDSNLPVLFYYVDDTIISGGTFQKANSLVRTLIPEKYRHLYGANIFKKCFLIVDRLSDATKQNYIPDAENDFHSFVHIDISNMRSQGDSCVGCKLDQEASRLFKRSSTYNIAEYWSRKVVNCTPVAYDDRGSMREIRNDKAFQRMILSHVAQNVIFKDNDSFILGQAYDAILLIAGLLLDIGKPAGMDIQFQYEDLLKQVDFGENGLTELLKVISRPFFSYDFKIRLQVMTFLIILAENIIGDKTELLAFECTTENSRRMKGFLEEQNGMRLKQTVKIGNEVKKRMKGPAKITFFEKCIMECLTDMRSTYLLRRQTIRKIYQFMCKEGKKADEDIVESFWKKYSTDIHYIVDCSSDEMRAMVLTCLLVTGKEYNEFVEEPHPDSNFTPDFLYHSVTNNERPEKRDPFYIFCHEVLFQNTMIPFDGMEKTIERGKPRDAYFMEQWRRARYMECFVAYDEMKEEDKRKLEPSESELDLFMFFRGERTKTISAFVDVKDRYDRMLDKFAAMITDKYGTELSNLSIGLLTQNKDCLSDIAGLEILATNNVTEHEEKYVLKNRIMNALKTGRDKESVFRLDDDGYYISDESERVYFILYFKNPDKKEKNQKSVPDSGRMMNSIARVFLNVSFELSDNTKRFLFTRYIIRDILMFRNRLMRMLEQDFAGDMFEKYSHTMGEKNVLAQLKAIGHNSRTDNDELLSFLTRSRQPGKYSMLSGSEALRWLTLKNYVNEQIATIFNRSFLQRTSEDTDNQRKKELKRLYLDQDVNEYMVDDAFSQKFSCFDDLDFSDDDRFVLLATVLDIRIAEIGNCQIIRGNDTEDGADPEDGEFYNLEYMKCLILDIFISAINNQTCSGEYLSQINELMENQRRTLIDNWFGRKNQEDFPVCSIKIYAEKAKEEEFDYLVLENPVQKIIPSIDDENRRIDHRLKDPLDCLDGHLSLLAMKQYVEGLREDILKDKAVFSFIRKENSMYEKGISGEGIYFQTKLPVLSKGGDK